MSYGKLYVVATPIGNLEDISQRGIQTLQQVQLIAVEDTRHAARLLNHYNITTPVIAVHDHNEQERVNQLISKIQYGQSIALISDAGTPLISDPGYRLVKAAQEAGITVHPIPGACAAIAALSAAGLPSDRFLFEGFLPHKSVARQKTLELLKNNTETLIFYEAPHRILESLKDFQLVFGDEREMVFAREITKTFETIKKMPIAELVNFVTNDANQQKGEIVLILAGVSKQNTISVVHEQMLQDLLELLPPKQAAQLLANWTGIKKSEFYDKALTLKKDNAI